MDKLYQMILDGKNHEAETAYWRLSNLAYQVGRIQLWLEEAIDAGALTPEVAADLGERLGKVESIMPDIPQLFRCRKCGAPTQERANQCNACTQEEELYWAEIEQAEYEYDMAERE